MINNDMILEKNNIKITQKRIKANIKNQMYNKNINILGLSKKSHINIYILTLLLYFPLSKVKLTKAIKICKALELKLSDILI